MRILLVAMCDSVHTARWVEQLHGSEVEFVLFPSTPNRRLHPRLKMRILDTSDRLVTMNKRDRILAFPLGLLDLVLGNRIRSRRVAHVLRTGTFDMVHLLETQHAGYLFHEAKKKGVPDIPVALSLWGSDLNWFGHMAKHRSRIADTLSKVDWLFVECQRDVELARGFGYKGKVSPPIPASGGVGTLADISGFDDSRPPSERTSIVVKGYTGFVGKADVALRVLGSLATQLRGRPIHFYSVSVFMSLRLRLVRRKTGLDIRTHRKKTLSHHEVLELFRSARISLSLSLSDGLPGSMREAAWTGAFPIESKGSCVCEWTQSGIGVLVVDPNNDQEITDAVLRALEDDDLVDRAVEINRGMVLGLATEKVRETTLGQYRKAVGQ
jgi:hypothetical protein